MYKLLRMKKLLFLIFILYAEISVLYAQQDTSKPEPGLVFADIHFFAQADLNDHTTPSRSFGINTAILGYKRKLSSKITGTLLYDVTRTTSFIYPDSIGISSYYEGSKYTAFLKMAEIDWKIKPWIEINVGQMLNEQYLTVQDKHWGYRYVNTTMQEYFRFGSPADFGARVLIRPTEKITTSLSMVNGEGPLKYQDKDSKFLYSANIEYRPVDFLIFKVYGDIQLHTSPATGDRTVLSAFAGFKSKKGMFGAEYSRVDNSTYTPDSDLSGLSLYGSYKINAKSSLFARADYLSEYGTVNNEMYFMAGAEYRPVDPLGLAMYIKRMTWLNTCIVGLNAGIRF